MDKDIAGYERSKAYNNNSALDAMREFSDVLKGRLK